MPLITRDDSLLVVVDLQPHFWGDRLDPDDLRRAEGAAARAAWLAGAARVLGVPAVITEEDPEQNGPTDEAVLAALRPNAPVFTKPVFGLATARTSWKRSAQPGAARLCSLDTRLTCV